MVKSFTIQLLFILLALTACKKSGSEKLNSSKLIIGGWNLASYSGGIAGFRHYPVASHTNLTLTFDIDGTYKVYNNGSISNQTTYSIIKNYQFSKSYIKDALKIGNDIYVECEIIQGKQDTLFVTPSPDSPDSMTDEYVRVK